MNQPKTTTAGFTLIELSIVLVIIGLIVGGVLVGQDLIKAAEMRATISQLEKYDAAAMTFRGKFNGLPGDIANAGNYGLATTGITTTLNGNGLIDRAAAAATLQVDQEAAEFFPHLFTANLIGENVTGGSVATTAMTTTLSAYFPTAKMGRGNYVMVMTNSGLNYMFLTAPTAIAATGVITPTTGGITPVEAFSLDTKRDDGVPNTGTVTAVLGSAGAAAPATDFTADAGIATGSLAAGDCWDSTTGSYAMATAATKNTAGCNLKLRASF
jgi:prepilin-type N-terminal cleavage/methylation domain-containing protein